MPDPRLSWFFAFNDNSPAVYELIEGSVLSSLPYPMDRYCVCDTKNEGVVTFLESYGVRVIRTRVSFDEALRESDVATPGEKEVWRGTGLRLDIPSLIDRLSLPVGDYYLYTDTDVLFLGDPAVELSRLTPAYFAASGEFTQDQPPPYYNAGVLWANRRAMQETAPDLIQSLKDQRCRVQYPMGPYDQGLLNQFYLGKIDYLPCRFNWKPYWGFDEEAVIVHLHGPKVHDIRSRQQGTPMCPTYETLYAMRPDLPEVYRRYLEIHAGLRDRP